MQLQALLTFSILAACMAVTALPSSDTVKYGSGSSFVERAPAAFGNCNIDPGAICGTLATACAGALTDSDASVVWQTITCVCAGLWCGASILLDLLCCVGKLNTASCQSSGGSQTYTGDKDVDATQRIITDISSDGGPTFDYSELFSAIEVYGGVTLEGNTQYEQIVMDIMAGMTGSSSGNADVNALNNYLTQNGQNEGFGV
ncbi:uncharacterized protein STEHIDRAFT_158257 [Stereum hirsutum FP-91666 SS1]|uniref:uncharacterized protein n=1 Tax=Stereum hirsutum (strain FP-91666) TaxID=721885 RepID=UPI000444A06E|nr:uncharacterized protein STEHIDRAFT_158257 [Stereum hirsutum FP-91666 SS1]EIM85627.1 hypothetical protein STEHIDRAFT_158257 [Stereum hirsutum FP-91666 SS1]